MNRSRDPRLHPKWYVLTLCVTSVTLTPQQSVSEPVAAGPQKCDGCGKTVYPLERVGASGKVFHKGCFRCCVCNNVLKQIDYAHLDGKFYWYAFDPTYYSSSFANFLVYFFLPCCSVTHFEQLFKMNGNYRTAFEGQATN